MANFASRLSPFLRIVKHLLRAAHESRLPLSQLSAFPAELEALSVKNRSGLSPFGAFQMAQHPLAALAIPDTEWRRFRRRHHAAPSGPIRIVNRQVSERRIRHASLVPLITAIGDSAQPIQLELLEPAIKFMGKGPLSTQCFLTSLRVSYPGRVPQRPTSDGVVLGSETRQPRPRGGFCVALRVAGRPGPWSIVRLSWYWCRLPAETGLKHSQPTVRDADTE
jgi:hypothetical protein